MKLFGINLLIIISLAACNTLKWLPKDKRGVMAKPFMANYCNDHLKFHFTTYGSTSLLTETNYLNFIPLQVIDDAKLEIKKYKKSKIIYVYSDTIGLRPNQFYCIIFLTKKGTITPTSKHINSYYGSDFYQDTITAINDSFYKAKYTIPLKKHDIKILYYDIKTKPDKDEYGFFYRFDFFKEVSETILQKSLSTNEKYNCATLESIQNVYWDSINIKKGKYLAQITDLKNLEADYNSTADRYLLYEFLCTHFAFIDQPDSVKYYLQKQDSGSIYLKRSGLRIPDTVLERNTWSNAISSILTAAKDHKLLMFNEAHFDWRHRYLLTIMLDSLYNIGYRYLAIEALSQYDNSLMARKFPSQSSCYYLSEPYIANLTRQAIKKGFTLIAYEDTLQDNRREYNQALNIYNAIKHDTAAKIIVYAGYGHISKDTGKSRDLAMAGYLRKMTKQNPYTINQTRFADIFYKGRFFEDKPTGYYSSTLSNDSNRNADLYIINNLDVQPYDGIDTLGVNKNYELKIPGILLKENLIAAQIYIYNEYKQYKEKAVPIYIKIIDTPVNKFWFNLPENNYIAILENSFGDIVFRNILDSNNSSIANKPSSIQISNGIGCTPSKAVQ